MKPGELYWSLVDPIWDAISIYDGEEVFLKQFEACPVAQRTLFAAHWCQSEVRNGGFHQFFGNSTGVLAPEAASSFQCIGMPKTAALVSQAMLWFGPTYPRDREVRDKKLAKYESEHPEDWDPFEELDDQFFELIENENGGFDAAADMYAKNGG
ncbi:MAG: DMP19 family protein [Pirellulales bacterium]